MGWDDAAYTWFDTICHCIQVQRETDKSKNLELTFQQKATQEYATLRVVQELEIDIRNHQEKCLKIDQRSSGGCLNCRFEWLGLMNQSLYKQDVKINTIRGVTVSGQIYKHGQCDLIE